MKCKMIFILLCGMLLSSLPAIAQQVTNKIYIPEVQCGRGKTISVPVALKNDQEIVALQFKLQLPSGCTMVNSSWSLSDRKTDHTLTMNRLSNNQYLVVIYSPTNAVLRGNTGNLINFSLNIPESWEVGSLHPFVIDEPILSVKNGDNVLTDFDSGTLAVIADPRPDVAVAAVKTDKSSYTPGDKIIVSWIVRNEGDKETGDGWSEQLSLTADNGESYYLGTVYYGSIVGIGGTVSRQAEFVLPDLLGIEGQAKVKVKLIPGKNLGELAAAVGNNISQTEVGCEIAKKINLKLPAVGIEENNNSLVRCMLSRSGSWTSEQSFTFQVDKPDRLFVPETVTIPSGQSAAVFYIRAIDNEILNADSTISISVSGNGYDVVTGEVGIIDNELPALTMSASKNELEEGENFMLTVERELVKNTPLTVYLACDHQSRFSYPAQVIIPAGKSSATVEIQTIDDDLPDVTIDAEFQATAARHIKSKYIVILNDNDLPEITLEITPETVSESAGPLAVIATLRRLTHTDNKITVRLSDNSNGRLIYSSSALTLSEGVTEARFSIGMIDNALVDGDKEVDITAAVYISSCSCSATGSNAGVVHARLTILDNDGPSLQITSSQTMLLEGRDGAKLTITRNTSGEQPLMVSLSSDRDNELVYEHNVVIPARQTSVEILVTAKANELSEGDRTVTFTAQAEGFTKGVSWLMITDQTLPDALVNAIRLSSLEVEAKGNLVVTITVKNEGASILQDIVPVRLYAQSAGKTEAITTFYTKTKLMPGTSEDVTKTVELPDWTGQCYLYAVVNEDQKVKELMYLNNTSDRQTITLLPKFTVTVSTDKAIYQPGETVKIMGVLKGSEIVGVPVELYYVNAGVRQAISLTTDNAGSFAYSFQPLAYQIGHFAVGACYPGEGLSSEQASFDIYGLERVSNNYIANELLVGKTFEGEIQLRNPGNLPLSDLRVNVTAIPQNCEVTFDPISTIGAKEEVVLKYRLTASAVSESLTRGDEIRAQIITKEGANLNLVIYYRAMSPKPQMKASVTSIRSTMIKGHSRDYQFNVENVGDGETGNIYLSLPDVKWLTSATPATLPSLKKGEKTTIVLRFTPTDDMPLNIPAVGVIGVNCENGLGIPLEFSVEPVSTTTGRLIVDVWDEYTEYTTEAPHVEGATVKIKHPTTGLLVKEGVTGADGLFVVDEMPEGYYVIEVSAMKHATAAPKNILVDPGKDNNVMVYLNFQAISYSWDVKETKIEDKYEIKTTVEFETRVPVPVVKVDWPEELEYKDQIIPFVITNLGLITAHDVELTMPESAGAHFTFLSRNPISELAPGQAETMYVKLATVKGYYWDVRIDDPDNFRGGSNLYGGNNLVKDNDPSGDNSGSGIPCTKITIKEKHAHECHGEMIETMTERTYYVGDCSTKGAVTTGGTSGGGGGFGGWGGGGGGGSVGGSGGASGAPSLNNTDCRMGGSDEPDDPCEAAANAAVETCALGVISGLNPAKWLEAILDLYGAFKAGVSCRRMIDGSAQFSDVWGCVFGVPASIAGSLTKKLPLVGSILGVIDCGAGIIDEFNICKEYYGMKIKRTNTESDNIQRYRCFSEGNRAYYDILYNLIGNAMWADVQVDEMARCISYLQSLMNKDAIIELPSDYLEHKPENLSKDDLDAYINRWNNTMTLLKGGSLSDEEKVNVFDTEAIINSFNALVEVDDNAKLLGYDSFTDLCSGLYTDVLKYDEQQESSNSVCSSITLEFKQTMTFTRQAFRGTLTVYNGHETKAMENVRLSLQVKDEDGSITTEQQFAISNESIKDFGGETSGPWSLAAQTSGIATILFIPTRDAAPLEPKNYSFGGTLSYVDPFTGLEVTRTLYPQTLTVNPTPILDLVYFMQRDVLGDDPLTTDVVEPVQQAEFSLLISNVGRGDATKLSIETMQPQITVNDKGLDIRFEMVGSQLNGGDYVWAQPKSSIITTFGDLKGGTTAYAQWWFTSTLLGHFNKYDVEATHLTSYDNPNLSLLGDVTIHELIRSIKIPANDESRSMLTGFLVNDIKDLEDNPDKLFFSDGTESEVSITSGANVTVKGENTYILSVSPSIDGWNYGAISDPVNGRQKLISVVRQSDHSVVDLRNFWQTDCTLRDGKDPLYEKRLHFVDLFEKKAEQSYLLTFEPCPDIVLAVESYSGVPGIPVNQPLERITVRFNKTIEPDSFTAEDITLRYQGDYLDSNLIGISTENNQEFVLDLSKHTAGTGYYSLTVQTAGIIDSEGYKGKDGKQTGWNQLTDGKLSINIVVTPEASGRVMPESGKYDYGTKLSLEAIASEGYTFLNYKINDENYSGNAKCEYTVLTSKTIYVVFKPISYQVFVQFDEKGGDVTGAGIYEYNTNLQLTASPKAGYMFEGWKIADEIVTTDLTFSLLVLKNVMVEAVFTKLTDAVTISYELPDGWTWLSFNVKDEKLNNPVAMLNPVKQSIISVLGQQDDLVYDEQYGLYGSLEMFRPDKAYKMRLKGDTSFELKGIPYASNESTITLSKGWNWIGYIPTTQMSLKEAFANLTAEENDVIKEQDSFAVYDGSAWMGSLTTLMPQYGYMYYSNSVKSFNYAQGSTLMTYSVSCMPGYKQKVWPYDERKYADNMAVISTLYYNDGLETEPERFVIGAFVGDECRGVSVNVDGYQFITVHGDHVGEMVVFRAFDTMTGEEYTIRENTGFNNSMVGDLKSPLALHLGVITGIEKISNSVVIYPNPVKDRLFIRTDIREIEEVLIVDMNGSILQRIEGIPTEEGLDVSALTEGIYFVMLKTEMGIIHQKFMKLNNVK